MTIKQTWQLLAISLGQVPFGRPNLVLDQIKIIEQPFTCRCNLATSLNRFRQESANFQ